MQITPEGFMEVEITSDMIARAKAKAAEMGQLRNSIRNGEGNIAGFLGEEVVLAGWQGSGSASHNTYQHDILFDEISFEVKTKDRTVEPRLDYEASVANYNPNQKADFYVFVSLVRKNAEYVKAYIMGIISKADYFKKANFLKVGEIDPSNGWKVKADCFNLPYRSLSRFDESWMTKSVDETDLVAA